MGLIQTRVYIDFDNDLDFADADEDITEYVGEVVIERALGNQLNAGQLQLSVFDADGRFQPQNTSGPYGENLTIGRRVRVDMAASEGGEYTTQFYGFITEITPEYVAGEEQSPIRGIIAHDLLHLLDIRKITTGTLLNKTTGELVDLLLDNIGWDYTAIFDRIYLDTPTAVLGGPGANWRSIDSGQTEIPYCQWEKTTIAQALREICETEHGNFYISKDCYAVFEDRHYRNAVRDSQATLTDDNISELVLRYTDEDLFNNVEVIAHPRMVGTPGSVVFDAIGDGQGHEIPIGESREYYVTFSDPDTQRMCEATDIITPAAPTDYTANSAADGSGSDRTANITVSLEQDDNDRYKITVTNDYSKSVYLTKLQMRGTPLVTLDAVPSVARDELSIAQYLQRDYTLDSYLLSSANEAQDYADWLLYQMSQPWARVERLTLVDCTWDNALQIVQRELSDRVTIQSEKYNVSGDFFIEGITFEAAAGGDVRCEWQLSGISSDVLFFTLDIDYLDSEALLGY